MTLSPWSFGPVEILVVLLNDVAPPPGLLRALEERVRSGVVRVMDVVVAERKMSGSLRVDEVDADEFRLAGLDLAVQGLMSNDDIAAVTDHPRGDRRMMVIALEILWARALAVDLADLGTPSAGMTLIPAPVVNAVVDLADITDDIL